MTSVGGKDGKLAVWLVGLLAALLVVWLAGLLAVSLVVWMDEMSAAWMADRLVVGSVV